MKLFWYSCVENVIVISCGYCLKEQSSVVWEIRFKLKRNGETEAILQIMSWFVGSLL